MRWRTANKRAKAKRLKEMDYPLFGTGSFYLIDGFDKYTGSDVDYAVSSKWSDTDLFSKGNIRL